LNWYKKSQSFPDRLGQCYVLSGRYILGNDNAILVHGTINGIRWTGKDFNNPHAWIEENGEVYDPVMDWRLPIDAYYGMMQAKPLKKYDSEQASINMLNYNHWGPWDENNPPKRKEE